MRFRGADGCDFALRVSMYDSDRNGFVVAWPFFDGNVASIPVGRPSISRIGAECISAMAGMDFNGRDLSCPSDFIIGKSLSCWIIHNWMDRSRQSFDGSCMCCAAFDERPKRTMATDRIL